MTDNDLKELKESILIYQFEKDYLLPSLEDLVNELDTDPKANYYKEELKTLEEKLKYDKEDIDNFDIDDLSKYIEEANDQITNYLKDKNINNSLDRYNTYKKIEDKLFEGDLLLNKCEFYYSYENYLNNYIEKLKEKTDELNAQKTLGETNEIKEEIAKIKKQTEEAQKQAKICKANKFRFNQLAVLNGVFKDQEDINKYVSDKDNKINFLNTFDELSDKLINKLNNKLKFNLDEEKTKNINDEIDKLIELKNNKNELKIYKELSNYYSEAYDKKFDIDTKYILYNESYKEFKKELNQELDEPKEENKLNEEQNQNEETHKIIKETSLEAPNDQSSYFVIKNEDNTYDIIPAGFNINSIKTEDKEKILNKINTFNPSLNLTLDNSKIYIGYNHDNKMSFLGKHEYHETIGDKITLDNIDKSKTLLVNTSVRAKKPLPVISSENKDKLKEKTKLQKEDIEQKLSKKKAIKAVAGAVTGTVLVAGLGSQLVSNIKNNNENQDQPVEISQDQNEQTQEQTQDQNVQDQSDQTQIEQTQDNNQNYLYMTEDQKIPTYSSYDDTKEKKSNKWYGPFIVTDVFDENGNIVLQNPTQSQLEELAKTNNNYRCRCKDPNINSNDGYVGFNDINTVIELFKSGNAISLNDAYQNYMNTNDFNNQVDSLIHAKTR